MQIIINAIDTIKKNTKFGQPFLYNFILSI